MLEALLLALAAQSQGPTEKDAPPQRKAHLFEGMDDAQMCEDLKVRASKWREPEPPVTAQSAAADCQTKRIRGSVSVYATGEAFDDFILRFVAKARSNICNFDRPSMKAFAERGWRYAYIFTSSEGELRSAEVEC